MLVRRSNLLVPITRHHFVNSAWHHNADAITLDLEDSVIDSRKAEARGLVKDAIAQVGKGAADVFVRVNKPFVKVDIAASVWPGLRGIILPKVETAAEVMGAAERLTEMEAERGFPPGVLELIVLLESAVGLWNIRSILSASERITQVGIDESDLAVDLNISPSEEYDPFVFSRGRLVIEATAARVQPLGLRHPGGTHSRLLPALDIHKMVVDAKNLGMKGNICPHPSWVEVTNRAFTPTSDQLAYSKRVRAVFAEAVASGTASVPLDGRMIDVPVDEWARIVISLADACAARDAEKAAALAHFI